MTKVGGGGKNAPAASTADLTERLERLRDGTTLFQHPNRRADRDTLTDAVDALQALEEKVASYEQIANEAIDAKAEALRERDELKLTVEILIDRAEVAERERDECRAQYRTAWTDLERERDEWKARAEQMKDYADSADRDQTRTVRERDEAREKLDAQIELADTFFAQAGEAEKLREDLKNARELVRAMYREADSPLNRALTHAEQLREALREAESEIHLYLNTFDVEGAANRLAQARDGIRAALSHSTGSDDD